MRNDGKKGALSADLLADGKKWEKLAEILVEDGEYLGEEGSDENVARGMKRKMRKGVQECRDVYFAECTMLFRGRVDWRLSPKYQRKADEELAARRRAVKEEEEDAHRQESSAGTLVNSKRFSEATTIVTDSLKRHSRELGGRVSGLFRRALDAEEEREEEKTVNTDNPREMSRPPCQEALHYPIFDPGNPSHLSSRRVHA